MYFTFVYARFQVHVRNMHPYMHACGGPRLILGIIPHHSSLSTEAGSLTQTQGLPTCSVLPSKRWPPLPPAIYVGSGVLNSGRHVSVASTLTTEPPPPNGGGRFQLQGPHFSCQLSGGTLSYIPNMMFFCTQIS